MSLSAASSILALHAFLLLTLLVVFAAMVSSIPVPVELEHGGDVNTTTTTTATTLFTNSSSASDTSDGNKEENWEWYLCFLCSGRDTLLLHHCPIYWDECHMICWDDRSAAAIPAAMAATAPPAPRPAAVSSSSDHDYDDCYVMKLYVSGRYVIVEHRPCKYIGECFLTCGGGELAAAAHRRTTVSSAATTHGSFLPVDAEVCGTQLQVNAPPSAPGGVFGPAAAAAGGGAHRRRR